MKRKLVELQCSPCVGYSVCTVFSYQLFILNKCFIYFVPKYKIYNIERPTRLFSPFFRDIYRDIKYFPYKAYIPIYKQYRQRKIEKLAKELLGVDRIIDWKESEKEEEIFLKKL